MMKLEVGDRIVYPFYGAGIVSALQTCEVLGKTGTYYVLSFTHSNLKLDIPAENAEHLGLRPLISPEEIPGIFECLAQPVEDHVSNWSRRHRENMDKLKRGNLCETAGVYRYLKQRERTRNLSTAEKKMLTTAFCALVSEISFVTGDSYETVSRRVEAAAAEDSSVQ